MKLANQPRGITLAEILAECAAPAGMLPERAAWFRTMLGNAIASAREDIAFMARHYGPGATLDVSRGRKTARIAQCEAALAVIANVRGTVPWVEVDRETAYGSTQRISRSIRVF
jgi:hypothetical protein